MKQALKEKQTTEKGFYFTQPENVVMFDNEITATAKVVYCALLKHVNQKTKKCTLYVKTIAEEVSRSVRTVQRSLAQLIEKKLIIRTERHGTDGRNLASSFTVTGPSSGFYSPDAEIRVSKPAHETRASKNDPSDASETETTAEKGVVDMSPTGDTSGGLINYTKDNYIITLKGKDILPNNEENLQDEKQEIKENPNQEKEDVPTLKHVPEIMRTTARYLLLRTGRKCLEWYEIPLLQFLASCHKPGRIQKEIDRACEIFIKKGRKLITLSFRYIAACLKEQKTFTPWEKSAKQNPAAHLKAYDDWFAEYGNLITEGAKADTGTSFADYDKLIIGGAMA